MNQQLKWFLEALLPWAILYALCWIIGSIALWIL